MNKKEVSLHFLNAETIPENKDYGISTQRFNLGANRSQRQKFDSKNNCSMMHSSSIENNHHFINSFSREYQISSTKYKDSNMSLQICKENDSIYENHQLQQSMSPRNLNLKIYQNEKIKLSEKRLISSRSRTQKYIVESKQASQHSDSRKVQWESEQTKIGRNTSLNQSSKMFSLENQNVTSFSLYQNSMSKDLLGTEKQINQQDLRCTNNQKEQRERLKVNKINQQKSGKKILETQPHLLLSATGNKQKPQNYLNNFQNGQSLALLGSSSTSLRKKNFQLTNNDYTPKEEKSVISNSCKMFNENFSKNLEIINQIEIRNQKSYYFDQSIDIFDTTTSKKSNKNRYNIISSSTLVSQALDVSLVNILKCEMNDFLYFKVRVFEQDSPLKLKLQEGELSANLKVLLSKSCFQPNNFNCDSMFLNSKQIIVDEERGQTSFLKQNFYYFALTSDKSQDVQIRVSFGQDIKKSNLVSNFKSQQLQQEKFQLYLAERVRESFMENVKEKNNKIEEENIIQKNITALTQIDQFTRSISVFSKKRQNTNRLKQVTQQGEERIATKIAAIQENFANKIKKKVIKINNFRLQFFIVFWTQLINLIKISDIINSKFQEKKESIKMFAKIAWQSLPLSKKFRLFNSKYPSDLVLNNLRYGRIAMESLANIIKKKKKKQAGKLMRLALKYNLQFSDLQNKLRKYHQTIVYVQLSYKIFKIKKNNFKKLLLKLWDKYFLMGMEQTIEVKKNGKSEQLYWRKKQHVFNLINSNEIKNEAVDCFFSQMMDEFRNRVTQYLIIIGKVSNEEKARINILQTIFNQDGPTKQTEIFENYNEVEADQLDVSFDYLNSQEQKNKMKGVLKKPRLFIVPTFKQIKSLLKIGVNSYAEKNPEIMEKIIFKDS